MVRAGDPPAPDLQHIPDSLRRDPGDLHQLLGQRDLRLQAAGVLAGLARHPREIGRQLGVDAVLEGSVRKAGERLRISAKLVDADTGYQRLFQASERNNEIGMRLVDVHELQ